MGFPIPDISAVTTEMRGNDIGPDEIAALISADAAARALRYQTLLSESRPEGSGTMSPYELDGDPAPGDIGWQCLVYGAIFKLPDPLPGSASQSGAGTGGTAATRGALTFAAKLAEAEAAIVVQAASLAGSYGQSSTFSDLETASVNTPSASLTWVSTSVLLPLGAAPGDDIRIDVYWRQYVANEPAKCGGWLVAEPVLTSLDP